MQTEFDKKLERLGNVFDSASKMDKDAIKQTLENLFAIFILHEADFSEVKGQATKTLRDVYKRNGHKRNAAFKHAGDVVITIVKHIQNGETPELWALPFADLPEDVLSHRRQRVEEIRQQLDFF